MRIRCWASAGVMALLSLAAAAQQADSAKPPADSAKQEADGAKPESGITYTVSGGQTVLSLPKPQSGRWQVPVERDGTVPQDAEPSSVKVVAEIPGSAILLTDTYSSLPGAMHYCQSGEESFLRVIGIADGRATETYHEKLESCRDNIELASPGLQWAAAARTLDLNWLSTPGHPGMGGHQKLTVGPAGKVEVEFYGN
jgi:hypothetical protein